MTKFKKIKSYAKSYIPIWVIITIFSIINFAINFPRIIAILERRPIQEVNSTWRNIASIFSWPYIGLVISCFVLNILMIINFEKDWNNTIFVFLILGIVLLGIFTFIAAIMIIKMKEPITEEKNNENQEFNDKIYALTTPKNDKENND